MRCKVGDKVLIINSLNCPEVIGLETCIVRAVTMDDELPFFADWIVEGRGMVASYTGMGFVSDSQLIPLRGDPDATEQDEYDAIPDMPVG